MQIKLTEKQREQLCGILATHLHNMRNGYIAAHGVDEKRASFYEQRASATERLLPLVAAPPQAGGAEVDDEDENEETET